MSLAFYESGIVIRPCVPDDHASVYEAVRESIDTVGPWMAWCHADYSIREVEEWFARCEKNWQAEADREFGIFDAESAESLGGVGINQINRVNNFANLGYWVRASRTDCGVASTAARLAAQFAFRELKLSQVAASVLTNASRSLSSKKMSRHSLP